MLYRPDPGEDFFFFNDTATTEIYTLSLHDALPISVGQASRIVPRLSPGAAVTSPRFLADWVVTERGAAALRGKGERGRAEALLAVAHPRFQGELERALTAS